MSIGSWVEIVGSKLTPNNAKKYIGKTGLITDYFTVLNMTYYEVTFNPGEIAHYTADELEVLI